MAKLSEWLDNPAGQVPIVILQDDDYAEVVGGYELDISKTFSTSYELGSYLANEVFVGSIDRLALLSDHGMWAWISLAFIDSLKSRQGKRIGNPLAKSHYVMESARLGYRLVARTAWDLLVLHGEAAKVALGSSKSPWGEMAEQMTSRQEVYSHRSFWPVANSLYSTSDGSVKRGATSQRKKGARIDPKNKAGLGSVRRLPFTFRQFERTYNLRRMTGEQIVALLPTEYQRWKEKAVSSTD
ncbi:hypothetical protein [Pseudomonas sp. LS-2]|uniref:hypothetical protein n=1 Tax=Pseudomonas sp. LS-2 TaxID=2315859 RepID=UPI0010585BD2|nr:hypothetical protein [Pseudomonas sp. LS-2]